MAYSSLYELCFISFAYLSAGVLTFPIKSLNIFHSINSYIWCRLLDIIFSVLFLLVYLMLHINLSSFSFMLSASSHLHPPGAQVSICCGANAMSIRLLSCCPMLLLEWPFLSSSRSCLQDTTGSPISGSPLSSAGLCFHFNTSFSHVLLQHRHCSSLLIIKHINPMI